MYILIWTEPAVHNLRAIVEYIELDKPEAAQKFIHKIFADIEKFKRFPKLGFASKILLDMGYRELITPPCRVFYRVEKKTILIVAVMRMEQDMAPLV